MKPKSRTLFHFMNSREYLEEALVYGFWPRYNWEDTSWLESQRLLSRAVPMVCFCDIPLSRIQDHVQEYGGYGLGMTREWGVRMGLNPVIYLSKGSPLHNATRNVFRMAAKIHGSKDWIDGRSPLTDLMRQLAFIKSVEGAVVGDESGRRRDFYQECEWRFVAEPDPGRRKFGASLRPFSEVPEGAREAENKKVRDRASLRFNVSDVRYIFVRCEEEIPQMVRFIESRVATASDDDKKIMFSRLTSLESLTLDA